MRPFVIVEVHVLGNARSQYRHRRKLLQEDHLVLEATPEALDDDVVETASFAIHRDLDALGLQPAGELFRGELAALYGPAARNKHQVFVMVW